MDERDLWWLAGLLEGEGSFCRPTPSSPNRPYVTLTMTDEDVVKRVSALTGVPYRRMKDRPNPHWKPTYFLQVRGARARELMAMLRPMMGERRRSQIDAALASYEPNRGRRLTPQQADEIRARMAGGERAADVGAAYGLSKWSVYKITQGVMYAPTGPMPTG